jgi:hypothetical protein
MPDEPPGRGRQPASATMPKRAVVLRRKLEGMGTLETPICSSLQNAAFTCERSFRRRASLAFAVAFQGVKGDGYLKHRARQVQQLVMQLPVDGSCLALPRRRPPSLNEAL